LVLLVNSAVMLVQDLVTFSARVYARTGILMGVAWRLELLYMLCACQT